MSDALLDAVKAVLEREAEPLMLTDGDVLVLSRAVAADHRVRTALRPPVDRDLLPGPAATATSARSAARTLPGKGTQRRRVLDALLDAVDHRRTGLTDDELETILGLRHEAASAARNSLMRDGWVVDSGQLRRTRRGHDAIIWTPTPASVPATPTPTQGVLR